MPASDVLHSFTLPLQRVANFTMSSAFRAHTWRLRASRIVAAAAGPGAFVGATMLCTPLVRLDSIQPAGAHPPPFRALRRSGPDLSPHIARQVSRGSLCGSSRSSTLSRSRPSFLSRADSLAR